MLPRTRNYAMTRVLTAYRYDAVALALTFGVLLLTVRLGHAWPQDEHKGSMAGMDMSGMGEMSDMGPTMAAMASHMNITPLRPKQPADKQKAKALLTEVKAMM